MKALAPADRTKLAKLLGMLGSDHAGERDAAALAANKLVVGRGLTWAQALETAAIVRAIPEQRTWQRTVAECLERPGSLRPWERDFLSGLCRFPRLSLKQRRCLNEIAERVLGDLS